MSIRMLTHSKNFKWTAYYSNSVCKVSAIKSYYCCCSRIICTDSQLCGISNSQVKLKDTSNQVPALFNAGNYALVDHQYFKTVSTDLVHIEDIIKTEEFKNILAKSSFFYDVNLIEHPYNRPISSIYLYSLEDISFSSVDYIKSKENSSVETIFSANNEHPSSPNNPERPTEQQLLYVIDSLTHCLLKFFERALDHKLYHNNIVFHNNIKGVVIKGKNAYIQTMYLLKAYGLIQFANVKVEILKITHHIEDGTVRVRWRVKGVYRHKVLLNLMKLKSRSWTEFYQDEADWLDGFSVFSVGPDGLIYKHVCDKMVPSDETSKSARTDLKSRIWGSLQLPPRPAGSMHALASCSVGKKFS